MAAMVQAPCAPCVGVDAEALAAEAYTRMALVYEERVVPRFEPIARRTVERAALRAGEHVLDAGCGTGLATLLAAQVVGPQGHVVGLDLSEGQLGVAVGKAGLRGVANVRFERGDLLRYRPPRPFDAALCNLGLPADAAAGLAALRRALRPGGMLSIACWANHGNESFDAHRAIIERFRVPDPSPEVAASRATAASRKSLRAQTGDAHALRSLLEGAGFAAARVEPSTYDVRFEGWRAYHGFLLAWGWTEAEVRALPGPVRDALHEALAERFGEASFVDPWTVLHATARAP